jgi:leucyl/phenylalanyl-tRNA--protein transferase
MQAAYSRLHSDGYAHSFETWSETRLVGGLYGIAIGKVFFGESMFATQSDASKVAFWHAVQFLSAEGFKLIDCQLPSAHLTRLGARNLPRSEFVALLARLTEPPGVPRRWTRAFAAGQ